MVIDGSLKGVSGRHAACGWAAVELDDDEEDAPWYAIHETMLAELEVQSTTTRAELWAFHSGFDVFEWTSHTPHG